MKSLFDHCCALGTSSISCFVLLKFFKLLGRGKLFRKWSVRPKIISSIPLLFSLLFVCKISKVCTKLCDHPSYVATYVGSSENHYEYTTKQECSYKAFHYFLKRNLFIYFRGHNSTSSNDTSARTQKDCTVRTYVRLCVLPQAKKPTTAQRNCCNNKKGKDGE